ncbi:MAG: CRISPR-associated (Cas) DxTHG family [Candidatus Sumerlaeota bacterium]|nr:CRISPR-associated (Cas) DxTHG family [Candidatus Sumerlaeota bacterium]
METLICIPGSPRMAGGEYQTARYAAAGRGEATDERVTPLLALVELYRPAHLVVLCTPEARKSVELYKEWAEGEAIEPRPALHVVDIALVPGEDSVPNLLAAIAAVDPPTPDVHLDLTFGPRSVTILAMLSALVQAAAGRWTLRRLTYVNFEARPSDAGDAPVSIEDLTAYLALPALATAVTNLRERGDLAGFARAAAPFFDAGRTGLQDGDLALVGDAVAFLRIRSLIDGSANAALGRIIGALRRRDGANPLLVPLMAEAERVLAGLRPPQGAEPGSPAHFAAIVEWYRRHGQPDRALLLASEALTLLVCTRLLGHEYPRQFANGYWSARDYYIAASSQAEGDDARTKFVGECYSLWESMRKVRGDFAHASLTSQENAARHVTRERVDRELATFAELCSRM